MAKADTQIETKRRRTRLSLALAFVPVSLLIVLYTLGATDQWPTFLNPLVCVDVIGALAVIAIIHTVWTLGKKSAKNEVMALLICMMYLNGLIVLAVPVMEEFLLAVATMD